MSPQFPQQRRSQEQLLCRVRLIFSLSIKLTDTFLVARVKKILAVDDEINAVSANASFAITIATVGLELPYLVLEDSY